MFVEKKFFMGLVVVIVEYIPIFSLKAEIIKKYLLFITLFNFLFKSVYTKLSSINSDKIADKYPCCSS
jgi:hypothetical protein